MNSMVTDTNVRDLDNEQTCAVPALDDALNFRVLLAAAAVYVVAFGVMLMTAPAKRIYWPLYLPLAALLVFLLVMRRR